jgi:hypothetical protein
MSEWKRDFQAGKAARINGDMLFNSASSAWQAGWKQQDEVLRLRLQRREPPRRQVVYAPEFKPEPQSVQIDAGLLKRRMMGGGRFVR